VVGSWTVSDWLILVIDVVAIAVVVVFLKRKIQHKLKEVEARQAHERLMRKQAAKANENGPPTE
jgi:heme exporter protein D